MFFKPKILDREKDLCCALKAHSSLTEMGASDFQDEESGCGCLPPCQYDEYDVKERIFENKMLMSGMGQDKTGLGIGLRSEEGWAVRDVYLYDLDSLVGDVGGFMGMFLGVSLITVYQWMVKPIEKALM